MCGASATLDVLDPMRVASFRQVAIRNPPVSDHDRSRFHNVLNERKQTIARYVWDHTKPNSSDSAAADLGSNDHGRLPFSASPTRSRVGSAKVGLIDLDFTSEAISSWADHRSSQLVQPCPGRLIASKTQRSLKPECARSVLLTRHPPHRVKPESQRLSGLVKQRAGSQRCLEQTAPTHQTSPRFAPDLRFAASGTGEAVRPPQGEDVRLACFLACEALAEFYEVSRVISARNWGSLEIHPAIIASRELSGYPLSVIQNSKFKIPLPPSPWP
jgi:hypothetical protein